MSAADLHRDLAEVFEKHGRHTDAQIHRNLATLFDDVRKADEEIRELAEEPAP